MHEKMGRIEVFRGVEDWVEVLGFGVFGFGGQNLIPKPNFFWKYISLIKLDCIRNFESG